MRLSRIAPHLCQPLPFLFPVWAGRAGRSGSSPSAWSTTCSAAGATSGRSSVLNGRPKRCGPARASPRGLEGATSHYDALTNDARLVIDTLRSAEAAGADLRNYTSFVGGVRLLAEAGRARCGTRSTARRFEVRAKAVVNAAGAWASRSRTGAAPAAAHQGSPPGRSTVSGCPSRGRRPVRGRRILFVIPWGERIILGTTDTDYAGDPAASAPTADVEYILGVVNRAFPEARIDPTT